MRADVIMDNPGYDTPADAADRRSSTASDNDVQKPQNGFSTIEPNDDATVAASYDDDSSRDNEKNSSYPPSYPDTYPSAYKSPDDIEMAERNGQPMRVNHSLDRILSVPEEVEEQRRAEREREPVFYCRWVVERPKTMFCKYTSDSSDWDLRLVCVSIAALVFSCNFSLCVLKYCDFPYVQYFAYCNNV